MSANCYMNVFLTGFKNAGKSSIINEFLTEYCGTVGGFRTILKKTPIDEFCGIYIVDITQSDVSLGYDNRAGSCTPERKPIGYSQVFETAGVNALSFKTKPDLIIMDELGVLENECDTFKSKVTECLDSEADVLGVIKSKSSDFLDAIRARKDVIVIDVHNYEAKELLLKLKEYLR